MMDVLSELISLALALAGAGLLLIAGIGILRLPDLLTRMHASSKAGTLGAVLILLAVAIRFSEFSITVRIALIILFLFLTAPVAAHAIARAGYCSGVPLSKETVLDEYREPVDEED
jgi:multicomponent Na+:H+ antiporter subunit G